MDVNPNGAFEGISVADTEGPSEDSCNDGISVGTFVCSLLICMLEGVELTNIGGAIDGGTLGSLDRLILDVVLGLSDEKLVNDIDGILVSSILGVIENTNVGSFDGSSDGKFDGVPLDNIIIEGTNEG